MLLIVVAIVLTSCITCMGSWYARKYNRPDGLIALYIIFVALSQLMASKIAAFDLGFMTLTAPAAVVVFPVTFLMTDIVNEKFGRRAVHYMIFMTFMTQVVLVSFLYLAGQFKPAAFWDGQKAWDSLFGVVPRITAASWITFLISENLDAVLFASIRRLTKGKHLWARNLFSSIPSLTLDTVCFITLAFSGTGLPLWALMKGQFFTKYTICFTNVPFMYLNRWILGPSNVTYTTPLSEKQEPDRASSGLPLPRRLRLDIPESQPLVSLHKDL